ncbi:unnamed protein product [Kuraishia capsulata CBS 1993]|uniref:Mitochondrial import protein 1 n=1 Tax=Kuraishia capsulata CBS 1993 TaxID=1382522 RepID=W6MNE7_9ASCO|nr:uncharacterized protein KUCA_T00003782001 [Kuraishia capsulata CBS 1993]CDK27803.1 unnamed protein product [Kuraishia capsulata CBS 1993]
MSTDLSDLELLGEDAAAVAQQQYQPIIPQEYDELKDIVEDTVDDSVPTESGDVALSTTSGSSVWGFIASCSINLFLPFVNGIMLGFGEILAHEIGFRFRWSGARVTPQRRYLTVNQQASQLQKSSFLS